MTTKLSSAFISNFLGQSPTWYKQLILVFLIINPFVFAINPFVAGWLLIIEFIITLAMALKCYPLQPGGLLAIQAIVIGMASPESVYRETIGNFEVILLLMFMASSKNIESAMLSRRHFRSPHCWWYFLPSSPLFTNSICLRR